MLGRKEYKKRYRASHKKEMAEYCKKYYQAHREKIKERSSNYGKMHLKEITKKRRGYRKKYGKKYVMAHRRELSERRLKDRHGLTLEDYAYMCKEQNGCCAICHTPEGELKECLRVDHDHNTGKIRGLLCNYCNSGLGFFRDNRVSLHAASRYLSKHKTFKDFI